MNIPAQSDKLLIVRDGRILCPYCNRKIQRVLPDSFADNIPMYCRFCHNETLIDIRGQSARRRSP